MCIAILNTAEAIDEQILINCYEGNRDGQGLIYAENGQLKIYKTLDLKEFLNTYYEVRKQIKTPIVIHFRMATHGNIDLENCHPFKVNKNLAFVHNGIIANYGNGNYSDTYCYNEKRLKTLQNNFLKSRFIREFIAEEIGSYNKLIFMDNHSNYTIVNEEVGIWENDNWYSNSGYKYSSNYWYTNDDTDNYDFPFNDDYFRDFYGHDLPDYYDQLDKDQKNYLFDLIDLGYDTPPDLDNFLYDYDIYSAIAKQNKQEQELDLFDYSL